MVAEVDLYQSSSEAFATIPFDALVDLRGNRGTIYLLNAGRNRVTEKSVTIESVQEMGSHPFIW